MVKQFNSGQFLKFRSTLYFQPNIPGEKFNYGGTYGDAFGFDTQIFGPGKTEKARQTKYLAKNIFQATHYA